MICSSMIWIWMSRKSLQPKGAETASCDEIVCCPDVMNLDAGHDSFRQMHCEVTPSITYFSYTWYSKSTCPEVKKSRPWIGGVASKTSHLTTQGSIVQMKVSKKLYIAGPLIIESPWAENWVSIGALEAANKPLVVQSSLFTHHLSLQLLIEPTRSANREIIYTTFWLFNISKNQ